MAKPRTMKELHANLAAIIEQRAIADGRAAVARRRVEHHAETLNAVLDAARAEDTTTNTGGIR